ncbi:hypothetical protein MTAT_04760 [Moorella thermoacetica]|uniref:Uncharacterized protein n=1 Tax=Neomoorella thermoacetica TaxID=1525 RepID=A0AAC9HJC5_NEOTH|nr:hypothetical protein [Moorella thermoacetica]AOQ24725.1 hypothetical protein Maut_02297 [Moorella thermoacetica]TYL15737.1 hypothetical protein MTAT_04760 [Moorella thermoacetica]
MLKGFWSDPDGLSIPDFLSLIFTLAYLIVTGIMVRRLVSNTLTDSAIDFYQIFTWNMLTVLGGWFGNQMISRLGGLQLRSRRMPEEYYPPAYTPSENVEPEPQVIANEPVDTEVLQKPSI